MPSEDEYKEPYWAAEECDGCDEVAIYIYKTSWRDGLGTRVLCPKCYKIEMMKEDKVHDRITAKNI